MSALYLQGISLVRRNSEWHHFDPLGTAQVITNSSAQVVSNNLYDLFGVLRYPQGSAQTPLINDVTRKGEEEISWLTGRGVLAARSLFLTHLPILRQGCGGGERGIPQDGGTDRADYCRKLYDTCVDIANNQYKSCVDLARATLVTCVGLCLLAGPFMPECQAGCLSSYGGMLLLCAITKHYKLRQCEQLYWECVGGKPGLLPPSSTPPALE